MIVAESNVSSDSHYSLDTFDSDYDPSRDQEDKARLAKVNGRSSGPSFIFSCSC